MTCCLQGLCAPILSFTSALHGTVTIHDRSLAERICRLPSQAPQTILLEKLIWRDEYHGGPESVVAGSFVTACDSHSTADDGSHGVSSCLNSAPVFTDACGNEQYTVLEDGTPNACQIQSGSDHDQSSVDAAVVFTDAAGIKQNNILEELTPNAHQIQSVSEQPDELHKHPDVSDNPDAGPEDLALIAEDLDCSKDQFLERKQLLENMMESLYEQHSRGDISLEDVNAAQTVANETLTNLDDAIARLDGMKARIARIKDHG